MGGNGELRRWGGMPAPVWRPTTCDLHHANLISICDMQQATIRAQLSRMCAGSAILNGRFEMSIKTSF